MQPLFSPGELVIASLCLEQSLALCADGHCREQPSVWLWRSQAQATRATQALVLSSQLYLVLLLIAESWLEWGEERLEVQSEGGLLNRGMEGERGTRQGRGDGRSLGTEQLPISQLPLLNTGITEEAKSRNIHHRGSIFPHPPLSLSLTALFSSLFIVVSILPHKLSFSDSFRRSLLHRLSWFSTFWCPPLCFLSLIN